MLYLFVSPQHALSDQACVRTFEPKTTCNQECLITTFQEVYFVSESFEEAKEKMRWTTIQKHTHTLTQTNTPLTHPTKQLLYNSCFSAEFC